MINSLIRKRSFEKARFLNKYWLIIVDATQLYTFKEKNDDQCLKRTFTNKETGEKTTQYYHSVLDYLIRFKNGSIPSVATEFHLLKEREVQNQRDGARWVNGISYNKRMVNVMEFAFQKAKNELRFQWITTIPT